MGRSIKTCWIFLSTRGFRSWSLSDTQIQSYCESVIVSGIWQAQQLTISYITLYISTLNSKPDQAYWAFAGVIPLWEYTAASRIRSFGSYNSRSLPQKNICWALTVMTGHSSLRVIIRKISSSFSRMKVCHSATHTTHEWRFQLDQVGFFAEFDCCGYRAVLVVGALCGVVTVGELDDCFLPALLLSFPLILLFVGCGYSIIGRGCGRGGGCGCGCGCCCCCSYKSRLANAQAVVATILINVSSNTQTLTGHVSGLSKQLVRIKKTWVYVGLNIWSLLSLFVETRPYTRDSRHSLAVVCSIGFWLKFILHAETEPIRQDPSTMADAGNSTLEFPFWHGKALHGYPISASPVERINRSSHTPSGAKTIVVWRCVKFFFCNMTLLFCLIAFVIWMQHWSKKVLLVCSTLANVKAIQGRRKLLHGMENAGRQTPCSSGSSLKHTEEAESWLIRLDLETNMFLYMLGTYKEV